jgi:hypothetical protein
VEETTAGETKEDGEIITVGEVIKEVLIPKLSRIR